MTSSSRSSRIPVGPHRKPLFHRVLSTQVDGMSPEGWNESDLRGGGRVCSALRCAFAAEAVTWGGAGADSAQVLK